jgi:hypothetical protein
MVKVRELLGFMFSVVAGVVVALLEGDELI